MLPSVMNPSSASSRYPIVSPAAAIADSPLPAAPFPLSSRFAEWPKKAAANGHSRHATTNGANHSSPRGALNTTAVTDIGATKQSAILMIAFVFKLIPIS